MATLRIELSTTITSSEMHSTASVAQRSWYVRPVRSHGASAPVEAVGAAVIRETVPARRSIQTGPQRLAAFRVALAPENAHQSAATQSRAAAARQRSMAAGDAFVIGARTSGVAMRPW